MTRSRAFWNTLLQHCALLLLALPVVTAAQPNYPTRPIRFITPYAPGGSTTTMAHVLGQKLTELNYATTGAGGSAHLASEMFNMLAGISTQHVPYKGAGAVATALMSGQVQLFFSNPLAVMPHIQSGRVKPIAVTGESRIPALPQVPTFAESGLRGLDVKPWFCVLAPAGTPKPIVDKLSAEFARIVATPEIQEYMAKQGIMPFSSTPEQLAALMKTDMAKWAKVIKAANIRLEK